MVSQKLGFAFTFLTFAVNFAVAFRNPIYIIRNAETPSLGYEGLTPVGQTRAEDCLPTVFGASSNYDIGLIISCTPNVTTSACYSAVDTATPLANSLNLQVDATCESETSENTTETCVSDIITAHAATSQSAVLIVWDKEYMDDLFDNFDLANDEPEFPEEWADIIVTIRNNHFVSFSSQECSGIDGPASASQSTSTSRPTFKSKPSNATTHAGDATSHSTSTTTRTTASATAKTSSAVSATLTTKAKASTTQSTTASGTPTSEPSDVKSASPQSRRGPLRLYNHN